MFVADIIIEQTAFSFDKPYGYVIPKELIDAAYAEELKNGSLFYRTIDLNEEEALADKYGVTWSSLIIVDYDNNGKEMSKNLTGLAFGNARTAPEKFKSVLSEQISEMLKN